mmetsp:Transcript_118127/g.335098  ORF Transcript_118127/g.335098 Transcript_118127/m.335098 type:complete len:286 (-) Transcript_118127:109-966(-)
MDTRCDSWNSVGFSSTPGPSVVSADRVLCGVLAPTSTAGVPVVGALFSAAGFARRSLLGVFTEASLLRGLAAAWGVAAVWGAAAGGRVLNGDSLLLGRLGVSATSPAGAGCAAGASCAAGAGGAAGAGCSSWVSPKWAFRGGLVLLVDFRVSEPPVGDLSRFTWISMALPLPMMALPVPVTVRPMPEVPKAAGAGAPTPLTDFFTLGRAFAAGLVSGTLMILSVGRMNRPCWGPHWKYRVPATLPSFLPTAWSNTTPTHSPAAKAVGPIKWTVPSTLLLPPAVAT